MEETKEKRQALDKSILVCGDDNGTKFQRTFSVSQPTSFNPSFISYEAHFGNSGQGQLDEFYPTTSENLERNENSQLVLEEGYEELKEPFLEQREEYLKPYFILDELKKTHEDEEVRNFIPDFEICYGCDEEGNEIGSAYIWVPRPKAETFEAFCEPIHKYPRVAPEKGLIQILSAIKSLAKGVQAMHEMDLTHGNISPTTIGFKRDKDKSVSKASVMLELDSITYRERKGKSKKILASQLRDIYDIGTMLFYAIADSEEVKQADFIYKDDFYDSISRLVKDSSIIQASEKNSHPREIDDISQVLKNCLAEPKNRYKSCKRLIQDLDRAINRILPHDMVEKKESGAEVDLEEAQPELDLNLKRNSKTMIQYHVFDHPLYKYVGDEEKDINVLVLGLGNYGTKFLNVCLEQGQMLYKTLNVLIGTNDTTDKTLYLETRPAIWDFFNVDGRSQRDDDYGNIDFLPIEFSKDNHEDNVENLKLVINGWYEKKVPHYVFIALGSDELNLEIAQTLSELIEPLEGECLINFTHEGDYLDEETVGNLVPIYINKPYKQSKLLRRLDTLVFNTWLTKQNNIMEPRSDVREQFKEYQRNDCTSRVLSIKSKLHSVGIDIEDLSLSEAAKAFSQILNDENLKHEFMWIEHRRWVTEKICDSWVRLTNLEECLQNGPEDRRHKRHVSILKSRPYPKLPKGDNVRWEKLNKEFYDDLDDLEKMSVDLQAVYAKRAQEIKNSNYLTDINRVKRYIQNNKQAMLAFQEWYVCLKEIWNNNTNKVKQYNNLKKAFLESLADLPSENANAVKEMVKSFESMFNPVLDSMAYKDYKKVDETLINNIPFILTYSDKTYMVIPYKLGGNTEIFSNVAAPTVVNPDTILYLYYPEDKTNLHEFIDSISYVSQYFKKKKLKSHLEFFICCDTLTPEEKEIIDEQLATVKRRSPIRQICTLRMNSSIPQGEVSHFIYNYLNERKSGKEVFIIERNDTKLSERLQGFGLYDYFDNYRFDMRTRKFTEGRNHEMFNYIPVDPYMTVSEMISFNLSSNDSSDPPEFYNDYKKLWSEYRKDSYAWKVLCTKLADYAKKNDKLAKFTRKKNSAENNNKGEVYRYIIPAYCHASVSLIIDAIKEHGFIEPESSITAYTTDSYEVIIVDKGKREELFNNIFSEPYKLLVPEAIKIEYNERDDILNIIFNDLKVNDFDISSVYNSSRQGCKRLLDFFEKIGYIVRFDNESNKNINNNSNKKADQNNQARLGARNNLISFTYANRQIKELLTSAGKILEIYTYHKIKELGNFDDTVSAFKVEWEGTDISNEFDCIVTRGFNSLFVECKTTKDLDDTFYYKLSCLANRFGINAQAVLIADTQEGQADDGSCVVNEKHRKRGEMMNVITIWDPKEISNIGHTLLKVIRGTYESK